MDLHLKSSVIHQTPLNALTERIAGFVPSTEMISPEEKQKARMHSNIDSTVQAATPTIYIFVRTYIYYIKFINYSNHLH